jgi:hypothetical protein
MAEDVALARRAALGRQQVAARHVAYVHDVEPGVEAGHHAAAHEIDDHLPGRRGLDVPGADRCGGIHDHHGQAVSGELHRRLLGEELGALVVTDHVGQADRR